MPHRRKPAFGGLSASTTDSLSELHTAWLTWEDSNFDIPTSKNAFEMSTEFPLIWPEIRLGDFCSCELWIEQTRSGFDSPCLLAAGRPASF
jgi:hypothetical protein